ncbi:hypothetical protein C0J52_13159 [Blattella germanica]|nr:hypothetical protein C0J52_13159 [Blattella germanica]
MVLLRRKHTYQSYGVIKLGRKYERQIQVGDINRIGKDDADSQQPGTKSTYEGRHPGLSWVQHETVMTKLAYSAYKLPRFKIKILLFKINETVGVAIDLNFESFRRREIPNSQLPLYPHYNPTNATLEMLQRLDSFEGPDYIVGNNFQIFKTLDLMTSNDLNPQRIHKWLAEVVYLKQSVSLEIYFFISLTDIKLLSGYPISSLIIRNCRQCIIGNNSFIDLSHLRSLIISSPSEIQVEQEAFKNMKTLQYLELSSGKELQISRMVFHELFSLKKLVLVGQCVGTGEGEDFTGLKTLNELKLRNQNISKLGAGVFRSLKNLKTLDLVYNTIPSLNAIAFRGLNNLQTFNLSYSNIRILRAGHFNICKVLK